MRGPAALVVLLGLALAAARATGQVVLDGSVGGTSGQVVPGGEGATYLIEESYGRRSGPNLFHSFSRFDIPAAQSAAFTGDAGIERVVGRVTGSLPSLINGTLRNSIEGADLYLFNPFGFVFSNTASLDLRGSLYLSSAGNLRFEDGRDFSAMPSSGEVLSSAEPSAWGFTSTPRTISFARVHDLGVPAGETLSLVGGAVSVNGVGSSPALVAPGGTIAIAARATPGDVPLDVGSIDARAALPEELAVVTAFNAPLDVSDPSELSASRGRIVIRSGGLTLDGSAFRAGSAADSAGVAPDIDLETTRTIVMRRSASLEASARGTARGGGVRISSESIALSSGSSVLSAASDTAHAGEVGVDTGSLDLSETSQLVTRATSDASPARINIGARGLVMTSGAQIGSLNESSADAPEIEISVEDLLQLGSGASLATQTQADGRGASLRIAAGSLEQGDGARVESRTLGAGHGGEVEIHASTLALNGGASDPGGISATSAGSGDAGGIAIEAGEITVAGGAQISATAEGSGRGGDIDIAASRAFDLQGRPSSGRASGVFARSGLDVGTTATGEGGSILVGASAIRVTDGAEISAQTYGAGAAGGVHVIAGERIVVAGRGLLTSSINAKASIGAGGSILIETPDLNVDGGGEISASTLERGDSGDIRIDAERVVVGGNTSGGVAPAGIFAQSIPSDDEGIDAGDGGDIEIRASELVEVRDGGLISARTRGRGAAGSVGIVTPVLSVSGGAEVSARSDGSGQGGDVEIYAEDRLALGSNGSISVTALGTGSAGEIIVRDTDLVQIEDGEINGRSEGAGAAGSVTLDGVGELIVGAGGRITTETLGDGRGGSIAIDAEQQVLVMNGGSISALSAGTGNAGSIAIDAGQRFSARNGGQVTTSAVAADGGDIEIRASRLIYIEDGRVTTDVRAGLGSGGNITLDPEFVVLNRAELRASAVGDGGNITIVTDRFVRDASSVVDASSELGIDGEIQTTSPTVDLTSELAQLDTTFLDASSKLAAACAARAGQRGTFAVRGRARAVSPEAPLGSTNEEAGAPGCDEPQP